MSGASGEGRAFLLLWAFVAFAAAGAHGRPHFEERTVTGRCVSRTGLHRGEKVRYHYLVTGTEVYLIMGPRRFHPALKDYAGKKLAVTGRGITLRDGTKHIYVLRLEDVTVDEDAPAWNGNVLVVVAGSRFSVLQYGAVRKGLEEGGYKVVVASSKKTAVGMPRPRLEVDVVITDVKNLRPYRGIVFCGGPGIVEYEGSRRDPASLRERTARLKRTAKTLLDKARREEKLVGAVALAPAAVLAPAGALRGRTVTGSTSEGRFRVFKRARASYTGRKVERDGNLITARFEGLGEFAGLLVEVLDEQREAEADRGGGAP